MVKFLPSGGAMAKKYAAVSMNEQQAQMAELMTPSNKRRRRGKQEKDDDDLGEADVDELAGFDPANVLRNAGSALAAIATIGANIFAVAVFGGPLHITAASVATMASVAVAHGQAHMEDIESLADATNVLRGQCMEIHKENDRLREQIDDLQAKVLCGQVAKDRLEEVIGGQDYNVNRLRNLIKEHREVIKGRRYYARADVEAELIRLIMKCDADESGNLDKRERERFIMNLKNLPTIKIDEKRLLQAIKKRKDIWNLIEMIKNMPERADYPTKEHPIIMDLDSKELRIFIEGKAILRDAADNIKQYMAADNFKRAMQEASGVKLRPNFKRRSRNRSQSPTGSSRNLKKMTRTTISEPAGKSKKKKRRSSSLTRLSQPLTIRPLLQRDLAFSPGERAGRQGTKMKGSKGKKSQKRASTMN